MVPETIVIHRRSVEVPSGASARDYERDDPNQDNVMKASDLLAECLEEEGIE